MPGLRLALTVRAFGPWGQAVKKMLEYKSIPYVPVMQYAGEPNEVLVQWTGTRNAPTLIPDDHLPLSRWLDQIVYIEEYKPTPSLLPSDSSSRTTVWGIIHELAGEGGLGWCRRIMLLSNYATTGAQSNEASAAGFQTIMQQYGYSTEAVVAAPARVADILVGLTARLEAQRATGSAFLVGNTLSAADIYWACFSSMVEPLPDDLCPMAPEMRASRTPSHPTIVAARDPILLEHRDFMFRQYLGPCEF